MTIALIYAASRTEAARRMEPQLLRFDSVDHLALREGETVVDGFEEMIHCGQLLFLLDPTVAPPVTRRHWAPILEHLEGCRQPPLGFFPLEETAVPQALRRSAWLASTRDVESWLAASRSLAGFAPAPLPWFEGRETELEMLFEQLVDTPGSVALVGPPRSGKSALAQHFARLAAGCFQNVQWIFDGSALPQDAGCTRTLYVIDGAPAHFEIPPGQASFLLTSREDCSGPVLHVTAVPRPDLTIEAELPDLALLCPHGFHRTAADLPATRLRELVRTRHLDPIDAGGDWYRLAAEASPSESMRPRWARAVYRGLLPPDERPAWLPEALAALRWSVGHDWAFAVELGRRAAKAFEEAQRPTEAVIVWDTLEREAEARGESKVAAEAASARAWLVNDHTGAYLQIQPGDQLSLFT